jgi:hypothetical protein
MQEQVAMGRLKIGVGEVDRDLQVVLGDRRVQEEELAAVEAELQLREEARALEIEAQLAGRDGEKVSAPIGHEEALAMLQDELRHVGGETRGEDGVLLPSAESAWILLGHAAYAIDTMLRYTAS